MKLSYFIIITCGIIGYSYADNLNFSASIEPLSKQTQESFIKNKYWNESCPVKLSDLSDVKMTYWGFDNKPHQGEMIIHKQLALEVVNIFDELFTLRFPIYEMKPYQSYPKGEYAKNNDTVGYYCSVAQDKPSQYSSHAYGIAVDINPLLNPFLDPKEGWWPQGGNKFSNRTITTPGMINLNDRVFWAFTGHGWIWGGLEKDIDYMHFSKGMQSHYVVNSLKYVPTDQIIRKND